MRVNLKVPFEQKDQAKALGARWDIVKKVWYVTNPESLEPFAKWMPSNVKNFKWHALKKFHAKTLVNTA